jgi:hypothetical protein
MTEEISALQHFDEASLDAAFATLAEEVRTETAALKDPEAFRLHWLGLARPQAGPPQAHQRSLAKVRAR